MDIQVFNRNLLSIKKMLCYYSFHLFLFQESWQCNLKHSYFTEKIEDSKDNPFHIIELEGFNLFALINIETYSQNKNLSHLAIWLRELFENFINFFERNLLQIVYSKIQRCDKYQFLVDTEMKVKLFTFNNKDLEDYFNLEKEFKYMNHISNYIKNDDFFEVLKKNCLMDNFYQ